MVKGLHLAEAFRIQHSGLMVNLYVGFTRNPEPKAQNAGLVGRAWCLGLQHLDDF